MHERAPTGDVPDARISRNTTRPSSGPTCYRKCSFISSTSHTGSFIKPPGQTHLARCISSQRDKEQRRDWRGFISMSKCQREAMSIRAPDPSLLQVPASPPRLSAGSAMFFATGSSAVVHRRQCLLSITPPSRPPTGPTSLQSSRKTSSVSGKEKKKSVLFIFFLKL